MTLKVAYHHSRKCGAVGPVERPGPQVGSGKLGPPSGPVVGAALGSCFAFFLYPVSTTSYPDPQAQRKPGQGQGVAVQVQ